MIINVFFEDEDIAGLRRKSDIYPISIICIQSFEIKKAKIKSLQKL